MDPPADWPAVAVVMPIRNEAPTLTEAVGAVLAQDYPGRVEVCLAVGPSADGTEAVAAQLATADPRVRVVANTGGLTAAALNAAIAATEGEIVARVDGHSVLPPGYLRRAVELITETGAANVGGVMAAEGVTPFEQAVARAMTSKFGTGDARFHTGGPAGPVDTVYLGVFRRSALERIGGYDETLERAQDAELNHRIRSSGGIVYFHPDLRVAYRPRSKLRALARQYFLYGRWRRVVVRRYPDSLAWRQLVAPLTLVGIAAGVGATALRRPAGLVLPATYAAATLGVSAVQGRELPPEARRWLPVVYATMHLAWAAGFLTSPRRLVRPPEERSRPDVPPEPSA